MATGNEPVHPAANIFPMMDGEAYAGLVEDIRVHGQREPVVYWKQQLLDGRNRLRACKELGIEPDTCELDDDTDPVAWVISANLHRRHLDESQRSMVGERAKKLFEPKAKENQRKSKGRGKKADDEKGSANLQNVKEPSSAAKAAAMLNVSERSIHNAATVIKHGSKELQQAVDTGKVSVSRAAKIAKEVPKAKQASEAAKKPERKEKTPYQQLEYWWEKADSAARARFRLYIDGEFSQDCD